GGGDQQRGRDPVRDFPLPGAAALPRARLRHPGDGTKDGGLPRRGRRAAAVVRGAPRAHAAVPAAAIVIDSACIDRADSVSDITDLINDACPIDGNDPMKAGTVRPPWRHTLRGSKKEQGL